MELEFENENLNPLQSVVQHIIFETNIQKKLDALSVVINALNEKEYINVNAEEFKQYLNKIFEDRMFIRKLNYISQLSEVPELRLEYAGKDYISSPEFHYNEKFENDISKIKKKVSKFLGTLLKEFNKGTQLEL